MTNHELGRMMSLVASEVKSAEHAHPRKIHVGNLRGSVAKRVALMLVKRYDISPRKKNMQSKGADRLSVAIERAPDKEG